MTRSRRDTGTHDNDTLSESERWNAVVDGGVRVLMECRPKILGIATLIAGCRGGSPSAVVPPAPPAENDHPADSGSTEPPCARGSALEVLACRAASCATKVHDATPPALAAVGWRIVQCDEPPDDGDVLSSGEGQAWLYRAAGHELTFASYLTTLGATAKYYNAATLTIASATTRAMKDGREVLWLRWLLTEQTGGGAFGGTFSISTTNVTICRMDVDPLRACADALIESREKRFFPYSSKGERTWTFSEHFDIELAGDGVDVKLGEVRGGHDEPEAQAGHHTL